MTASSETEGVLLNKSEVSKLFPPRLSQDYQFWFWFRQGTGVMKSLLAQEVEEVSVDAQSPFRLSCSLETARRRSCREADVGPGPATLPTDLSCRVTPKSRCRSLYAAEPERQFTDARCNVRFISVKVIIARVVWEACWALGRHVRPTAFTLSKSEAS